MKSIISREQGTFQRLLSSKKGDNDDDEDDDEEDEDDDDDEEEEEEERGKRDTHEMDKKAVDKAQVRPHILTLLD